MFLSALVPLAIVALGFRPHLGLVWAGVATFGPYAIAAGWAVFAARRWGTGSPAGSYGLRFRWWDLLFALAAVFAYFVIVTLVSATVVLVCGRPSGHSNVMHSPIAAVNILTVILAVLVAPVVEELVFRGMLLRALQRSLAGAAPSTGRSHRASVAAVAITAAAFAALHLPQLAFGVSPLIAVSTFVMGALFGTAAVLTGRIGTGIIAHALVNAIVASTLLLR